MKGKEDNTGNYIFVFGIVKDFLNETPKLLMIKGKDYSKNNNFFPPRNITNSAKANYRMGKDTCITQNHQRFHIQIIKSSPTVQQEKDNQ